MYVHPLRSLLAILLLHRQPDRLLGEYDRAATIIKIPLRLWGDFAIAHKAQRFAEHSTAKAESLAERVRQHDHGRLITYVVIFNSLRKLNLIIDPNQL
jgi:hypothetical protein